MQSTSDTTVLLLHCSHSTILNSSPLVVDSDIQQWPKRRHQQTQGCTAFSYSVYNEQVCSSELRGFVSECVFYPPWFYSPIQALASSMRLSVSLQLLDLGQPAGLLGRVISSSQGLYLYTNTEKRTRNTVPASERAKTVHVLDRSATVTGRTCLG
jgi:hypothetical protein